MATRSDRTSDVAVFVEKRVRLSERMAVLARLEGFNIFNHGNYLGRGHTIYGDTFRSDFRRGGLRREARQAERADGRSGSIGGLQYLQSRQLSGSRADDLWRHVQIGLPTWRSSSRSASG